MQQYNENVELDEKIEKRRDRLDFFNSIDTRLVLSIGAVVLGGYLVSLFIAGKGVTTEQINTFILYAVVIIILVLIFTRKSEQTFILAPDEAIHIVRQEINKRMMSPHYSMSRTGSIWIGEHVLRSKISYDGVPEPWYYDIGFVLKDNNTKITKYYVAGIFCTGEMYGLIKHIKEMNTPFRATASPDVQKMKPSMYQMHKELRDGDMEESDE